jgi:hypothetical protein
LFQGVLLDLASLSRRLEERIMVAAGWLDAWDWRLSAFSDLW